MSFVFQILYQGCLAGMLALSFAVVFVPTRIWHFAHGAVYVIGAIVFWYTGTILGWDALVAAVVSVLVCGGSGAAIYRGLYRPLQQRGAPPLVVVISSIGLMTLLSAVGQLVLGPGGEGISYSPGRLTLFGAYLNTDMVLGGVLMLVLYFGGSYLLRRSSFGVVLRAMIANRSFLPLRGIETQRYDMLAFFIGSGLVAIPAILFAVDSGVQAAGGAQAVLIAAMGVFLAGTEDILGALLAGFLLGAIGQIGGLVVSYQWADAIMFAAAAVFLLIRPSGFSRGRKRVV